MIDASSFVVISPFRRPYSHETQIMVMSIVRRTTACVYIDTHMLRKDGSSVQVTSRAVTIQ
jgi:hypothetical protein